MIKEEEVKQKEIEYIKIREWEEKFDREQKAREHKENLREERLRHKESEKLKLIEKKDNPADNNFSSGLDKFEVNETKEN